MLFQPDSGKAEPLNLIPAGTLAHVSVNCTLGHSKEHGGYRYELTLTVLSGPYKGRKVFEMLACPFDGRNDKPRKNPNVPETAEEKKERSKWRTMGLTAITRIFEAAGIFNPQQPESYAQFNEHLPQDGSEPTAEQVKAAAQAVGFELDGAICAIKVKIEKADPNSAYQDKNKVAEWLSSNPNSGGYKQYCELMQQTDQATDTARAGFLGQAAGGAPAPAAATSAPSTVPAAAPAPGGPPPWLKAAQAEQKANDPLS